ncbi:ligand-binding protein [Emticicia sp. CRIBPO]|uniref:polysaccharide biosynthesis/export family protein n=1 Tax=Emticicia sp. CRIBPO TaxID=2683258 RepID=UPI001412AD27|nr:polysaccharide biosynthesis/export family protein [Emticicia sp. CRIBPO]NBA85288.1 ligand-binding protein [Emticicia sp. CRIBPO]
MNLKTDRLAKIRLFAIIVLSSFTLFSCVDTKKVVYFQSNNPQYPNYIETHLPKVTKISTDDILAITVSSLSKESNEILNFQNINSLTMSSFPGITNGGGPREQPLGYRVDSSGNVVVPFIGKQFLRGLTLEEAGEKIKVEIEKYLKDPAVNITFLNHKFSVLGEVNRVGTFNLLDDRTTMPEALAMAGDLTIYGKRDSITIIRHSLGLREVGKVSLLNRDLFTSPYYYIQNGDVIYVEPIKGRVTNTEQRVQLVPIFTGIATTLVVLLNFIIK